MVRKEDHQAKQLYNVTLCSVCLASKTKTAGIDASLDPLDIAIHSGREESLKVCGY
jgi:hypothetical protein